MDVALRKLPEWGALSAYRRQRRVLITGKVRMAFEYGLTAERAEKVSQLM